MWLSKRCWEFVFVTAGHIIYHLKSFLIRHEWMVSSDLVLLQDKDISDVLHNASDDALLSANNEDKPEKAQDWETFKTDCQFPLRSSDCMAHWTVLELTSGTVKMTTKIASPWMIPTAHKKSFMLYCYWTNWSLRCWHLFSCTGVLMLLMKMMLGQGAIHKCIAHYGRQCQAVYLTRIMQRIRRHWAIQTTLSNH